MDTATEDHETAPLALAMDGKRQQRWQFVGGRWWQDDEAVISPPANLADHNLAFYTPQAYRDFEAWFEFRWDVHWTAAGFIFRAQDACHYYMVEFPVTGQQSVGETFWATISKVDERGWKQVLHMQMVHGVTSMPHIWHKVHLKVQGDEIRLWVDGRPVSMVSDSSYGAGGRIGLLSYGGLGATPKSSFRNLQISGQAVKAPVWDDSIRPRRNWGVVDSENGNGCGHIVRAGNGELLVQSGPRLMRSADNGQTWSSAGKNLPGSDSAVLLESSSGSVIQCLNNYTTEDGRPVSYLVASEAPFKIRKFSSDDNGKTWSELREVGEVKFPPHIPYTKLWPSPLLKLKDGTLLIFAYATKEWKDKIVDGRIYFAFPLPWSQIYCLRSTDGGESWSELVNVDGLGFDITSTEPGYEPHGKDHLNEICAAQTRDGRIMALIRGMLSPFIWESWSDDGGKTWTPAARGPFPMWACTNSMIATSSGVLLIGGRFPGMAVQVSYDDGMTWHCYGIDTCLWANGAMYEIEPDVVLFVYGGWDTVTQMRYQILRVTPEGLKPGKVVPFGSQVDLDSLDVVPLDEVWRFKTDPQSVGVEQAWFAPQMPESDWARLRIDRAWNLQGFHDFHGRGWYRTRFKMPEDFDRRKHLWLLFGAVDKEAYVYIDGKKVFEHTRESTGLAYERLWNMPFKVGVRGLLQPGREHVITVRVESPLLYGGIWQCVWLVSANKEMPLKKLLFAIEEKWQQ